MTPAAEALELVRAGKVIDPTKLYREVMGLSRWLHVGRRSL